MDQIEWALWGVIVGIAAILLRIELRVIKAEKRLDRTDSATLNLLTSFEDHEERIGELENNKALRVIVHDRGRV